MISTGTDSHHNMRLSAIQTAREAALRPLPRISYIVEDGLRRLLARVVAANHRAEIPASAHQAPVIPPISRALLKAEIEALPREQCLVDGGQFTVHYARADQAPWCLQEIGRLRELTFRAVGEGTGKTSDIDLFDAYYLHLFLWDARAEKIVGAYRLGLADEIVIHYGVQGLYTQSLFKYGPALLNTLNPAIELGRSFVCAEYQRSFSPLALLWRGIGQFILRSPRYAVLFGPVSISNNYAPLSRELMVEYLTANNIETELARLVKPRRPFRGQHARGRHADVAGLTSIEDLSRLVSRIEPDSKGVPILLKQYLKLGGRLLGFSADDHFSHALDGLIVVDLRVSDPRALSRYMGEEGARAFYAYHQGTDAMRRAS